MAAVVVVVVIVLVGMCSCLRSVQTIGLLVLRLRWAIESLGRASDGWR